jgi:hypothetical protein
MKTALQPFVVGACALILAFVAFGQSSESKVPTVIIDSTLNLPEHQTTLEELNKRARSLRSPDCNHNSPSPYLESPMRLGDSLKGRVKTIRVIGFAPMGDTTRFSKLKETVLSVWEGQFRSRNCLPQWAEMGGWFVEARLEFEDGKSGILISDGVHVVMQDHDGMTWYLRLLPAGQ